MAEYRQFFSELRIRLQQLYHGRSEAAIRYNYALLGFDVFAILYFVFSTMVQRTTLFVVIDFLIGLVILLDLSARMWLAQRKLRFFTRMTTIADSIVLITLFAPAIVENFIFLRVLRALRILRSFHVMRDLRNRYVFFRRREDVIQSIMNLAVFLFIITALVYVMQAQINPGINNYLDALYFTVATLTTTGFGDVTLAGGSGRMLSVLIMVVGITLFLRLVQTIFRPAKVRYKCPVCGLNRHDVDAVHCKHCGEILAIETEGG